MLNVTDHETVRELRMDRPPVNALNQDLMEALREALDDAGRNCDAVVISGRPGLFSAGLDVPELLQLDREGIRLMWRGLFTLLETTACSPVPVVAAITGHCPAGGAVLSLFCDYRVMTSGAFKIGLNETQVGLVVPEPIRNALVRLTGPHRAERLVVGGSLLGPEEALEWGMVDSLSADPESTVADAVEWCRQLLSLPRKAMLRNRVLTRADFRQWFTHYGGEDLEQIVDHWFAEETQQVLHALVAQLRGGKK
jgi:enoyl-CoA hydratase/carnithine racemase